MDTAHTEDSAECPTLQQEVETLSEVKELDNAKVPNIVHSEPKQTQKSDPSTSDTDVKSKENAVPEVIDEDRKSIEDAGSEQPNKTSEGKAVPEVVNKDRESIENAASEQLDKKSEKKAVPEVVDKDRKSTENAGSEQAESNSVQKAEPEIADENSMSLDNAASKQSDRKSIEKAGLEPTEFHPLKNVTSALAEDGEDSNDTIEREKPAEVQTTDEQIKKAGDGAGQTVAEDAATQIETKLTDDERSLLYACEVGNFEEVQKLVSAGVNINVIDDQGPGRHGKRPLHWAVLNGHTDIVRFLLKEKADADPKDVDNQTPFFFACGGASNEEVVKLLLKHKPDMNVRAGCTGTTPAINAAFWNKSGIMAILIQHGLDPNFTNNLGSTPLHTAAEFNYVAIVTMLLANGANVNAKDEDGKTPLDEADSEGDNEQESAEVLKKHGGLKGCDVPESSKKMTWCCF